MTNSHYENFNSEILVFLSDAINEENYSRDFEYIIVIRNVTDGYNVDFTHTIAGDWANTVFEQSCDIAIDCAYANRNTKYVVIFCKVLSKWEFELIKAESYIRRCVN